MSSHYFVKENQEYTAVFIDIPDNTIWEEYLGWQPYVIGFEGVLDELILNKILLDEYWISSSSKPESNFSEIEELEIAEIHHFEKIEEAIEPLIQNHPNNSLIFFVSKKEDLFSLLGDLDLSNKNIEGITSNERCLLIHSSIKKWLPKGVAFNWTGNLIEPGGGEIKSTDKDHICQKEGLFEFKTSRPSWLSIYF